MIGSGMGEHFSLGAAVERAVNRKIGKLRLDTLQGLGGRYQLDPSNALSMPTSQGCFIASVEPTNISQKSTDLSALFRILGMHRHRISVRIRHIHDFAESV